MHCDRNITPYKNIALHYPVQTYLMKIMENFHASKLRYLVAISKNKDNDTNMAHVSVEFII